MIIALILIAWVFRPRFRPADRTEFPQVLTPTVPFRPSSKNWVQRPSRRHQQNIIHAESVLKWLRSKSPEAEFSVVIATLRRLTPYVFEELLLTCCREQGWRIQRNLKYSGDGGVDGRVLILSKLYLLQAKRYVGYIKPQHIKNFQEVIQLQGASGGFFVHSGKTGGISKQLLQEYPQVNLLSGQRLVDFVLGKPLRIVGVTIPPE
ncbi:restriction endonuclease [Nostoc sp. TCL26-01]|uniref:restriction endonuclease n=1 Tax=Nostoc sp. TCL26-01 TaxID=2576904 RepID=UPI002117592B|nr:restriction endonuclease [Nostoc sp. TCL26-01]